MDKTKQTLFETTDAKKAADLSILNYNAQSIKQNDEISRLTDLVSQMEEMKI